MVAQDLIMQLLAGGLLGIVGQGLRAVAGMKKVRDQAAASGKAFGEVFEGSQLLASLVVGFTAGALAMLAAGSGGPVQLDRSLIVAIASAGYSGTDFIEAFMAKAMPPAMRDAAAPRQPTAMG